MAKKDDKLDQLLNLVGWLVKGMEEMKDRIDVLEKWNNNTIVTTEEKPVEVKDVVEQIRETPYKVVQVQSVWIDESYEDPMRRWEFKVYSGLWKTFKNKQMAMEYLERAKKQNPWIQYDIFPV